MSKAKLFNLIEREGLLGLYRAGLFDGYTYGGALQLYWENAGLPPLIGFRG